MKIISCLLIFTMFSAGAIAQDLEKQGKIAILPVLKALRKSNSSTMKTE